MTDKDNLCDLSCLKGRYILKINILFSNIMIHLISQLILLHGVSGIISLLLQLIGFD